MVEKGVGESDQYSNPSLASDLLGDLEQATFIF